MAFNKHQFDRKKRSFELSSKKVKIVRSLINKAVQVIANIILLFCLFYFGYLLVINSYSDTSAITISAFVFSATLAALCFSLASCEFLTKTIKLNTIMAGVRFLTASILFLVVTIFKYAQIEFVLAGASEVIIYIFQVFVGASFLVAIITLRWGTNRLIYSIVEFGKENKQLENKFK